ncbi:MAG: biofilm regulation phosphoprotein SiaC [Pseudomonadota bacterium]
MNDFSIPGTQSSPEIQSDWDAGRLLMRGDSYPENAHELFRQVFGWIDRFLAEAGRPLQLELHLLYLNTSSIKALMDVFDLLEEAHGDGKPVSVVWHYDQRNERVYELAGEFKEDCTFPFEIVSHG